PGKDQRRDLSGYDEEDSGRRFPYRGSAGPPLPPRLRPLAVLQLRAHLPHRHRRDAALVRARHQGHPSSTRACRRSRDAGTPRIVSAYTDFYKRRRVMITGGLGFIGSNIARRLTELEADVLLM